MQRKFGSVKLEKMVSVHLEAAGPKESLLALELKLAKKVKADKEGARPPLPRILWWKEFQRLSHEDSTCCLLTSRLMVTHEVVWVVQRWHRMEERSSHTKTNVENESERSSREP